MATCIRVRGVAEFGFATSGEERKTYDVATIQTAKEHLGATLIAIVV